MEYLLVVGFSLLLIIPLIVVINDEYHLQKQDVDTEHLSSIAREIAYQSEKIYYQGAPSTTTITASFPQGVTMARVEEQGISFKLQDSGISIYAESQARLQGSLGTHPGKHTITLRVEDNDDLDPSNDRVIITDT